MEKDNTQKEEIKKIHWIDVQQNNRNLIIECKIKIAMAQEMIKFCEKKIAEFPEEKIENAK
jgi:hypothetical protein